MTFDADTAGSEFGEMARKAVLGQEAQNAGYELDIYRYDFASKVAQGESITQSDMFSYLNHFAAWEIAVLNLSDSPLFDLHTLKSDCENQNPSNVARKYLNERINWAKNMVPVADRVSLKVTGQSFLGMGIINRPLAKGSADSMMDVANQSVWMPFELKGLESCTKFFKKK